MTYSAPTCKLTVYQNDETVGLYELNGTEFTIGREESCSLVLRNRYASRIHATLIPDSGSWLIHDGSLLPERKSANGVFVNGVRRRAALLEHGDTITIAGTKIIFAIVGLSDAKNATFPGEENETNEACVE